MGSELAEREEWSEGRSLSWALLENEANESNRKFLSDLLHFYKTEPALYGSDYTSSGFEWVDLSQKEEGVFAFLRKAEQVNREVLFVFNFSEKAVHNYCIEGNYDLQLNTAAADQKIIDAESFTLKPYQGLLFKKKLAE